MRIGVINPHDMALDAELWRWVPVGVSLHCTRLPPHGDKVDLSMVEGLSDPAELAAAARSIAQLRPDAYAYACTSGSFVGGVAAEERISRTIAVAGGAPAVTTSGALVKALSELGVQKISVATPYIAQVTARLVDFLAETGVQVVRSAGLGRDRGIETIPARETAELVRAVDDPDSEAIFLSCTNLPTIDVVDELRAELGKPVISANQVTLWAALRAAGASAELTGVPV